MKQTLLLSFLILILTMTARAQSDRDRQFEQMVDGAEHIEGFFDLYRTSNKLYMAVRADQIDEDFILNYQVGRGIGAGGIFGGTMLNVMESNIVALQVRENKVFLVNKQQRYRADEGTPQARAVDLTYGDSVLEVAGVDAIHSDGILLIDVYDWFVGDLSNIGERVQSAVGRGSSSGRATFDRNRSNLDIVQSFPDNTNIQANLTFRNAESSAPRTVPDHRFVPVSVFYSMSRLPEEPMQTREADDRIGYFMTVHKDFTSTEDEFFRRHVNRWRLECGLVRMDGLCEPKKPITYYLENTIPKRYRRAMIEGVEAWSAAFEEAGFHKAVRAEILPDSIDAGDVRYPTLRWNVSDQPGYGALGPSVVDPRTGEILDANMLFEANMFLGFSTTFRDFVDPQHAINEVFMEDEYEMEAMKMGHKTASFYSEMGTQSNLMRVSLLAAGLMEAGAPMPDEYVDEAIRWVTMHEVGHTLGLRHNFRSSTDTPLDKLYDREWTSRHGVSSSVMDYPSPNIALNDTVGHGHFYNEGVGSYDRWAISYGYTLDDEEARQIARRSAEPGHAYGTDEDARGAGAIDPNVNAYSLGEDPLAWGRGRADLIRGMLDGLPQIALRDNMPYYEVSDLFQSMFFQYARALTPTVKFIGGQYQNRDHVGDPNGRMPFEPVPYEKQVEALNTIIEYAFSEDAFQVPQEVYQQFGANRWNHWGVTNTWGGRIDFPLHKTILDVQTSLLTQLFNSTRLERIRDTEMKFGQENTLSIPELMATITEAAWKETWNSPGTNISSNRRDFQRAHLDIMIRIVTNPPSAMPADARSVARVNLMDLHNRLDQRLSSQGSEFDAYSAAHLMEARERISRALDAGFTLAN